MATPCFCAWVVLTLLVFNPILICRTQDMDTAPDEKQQQAGHSSGIYVHFNNPKLLMATQLEGNEDDEGAYDTTEDTVDPKKIGGVLIKEEAKKLGSKLRVLSNEEIGVMDMQVKSLMHLVYHLAFKM